MLSVPAGLVLVASLALFIALCVPAQRQQMGGPAVIGGIFEKGEDRRFGEFP